MVGCGVDAVKPMTAVVLDFFKSLIFMVELRGVEPLTS
jgi:hypothetical protein